MLYMFRVVPPPIIRSAYNCIYSIWYLSDRYCYLVPHVNCASVEFIMKQQGSNTLPNDLKVYFFLIPGTNTA